MGTVAIFTFAIFCVSALVATNPAAALQSTRPKLSDEQKAQLKTCFELMDSDGSGAIDVEELADAFDLLGLSFTRAEIKARPFVYESCLFGLLGLLCLQTGLGGMEGEGGPQPGSVPNGRRVLKVPCSFQLR